VILDPAVAWWAYPLVIVDFETTGVDTAECMPVSVAAVRLERGRERGQFYSLLQPGIPIPPSASEIHGITDELVKDAPELPDVALELYALAKGALPCGYNGESFDKPILHRFVVGTDCPLFEPMQPWLDPLVMIRTIDRWERGPGRHKLATVCERWGVPFADGEAHNALADVRAVGRLLCELVRLDKVRTDVTLGRMLSYIALKRAEQDADYAAYRAKLAAKEAQRELVFDDETANTKGGPCQAT
jgi:DNA polymerase-3 subunit epsilon